MFDDPDSDLALKQLPSYLEAIDRWDELINYLSAEHFNELLQHSQSLAPLSRMAQQGIRAALERRIDSSLFRFSMQRSQMIALRGADVWSSEIEARIVLDDYTSALNLSQSAPLKEDRLHLLAIIARLKRQQKLSPEPELLEQIRLLYNEIEIPELKERAIDIATDLMFSCPDLAIELVEKTTGTEHDEFALDRASLA